MGVGREEDRDILRKECHSQLCLQGHSIPVRAIVRRLFDEMQAWLAVVPSPGGWYETLLLSPPLHCALHEGPSRCGVH